MNTTFTTVGWLSTSEEPNQRLAREAYHYIQVRPLSGSGEQLLRDLLDASAALWNEVNYEPLMRYNDEDGDKNEDTFEADTGHLEGKYKGVLGAATAQQVI